MKRWIAAVLALGSGLCLWWRYHKPERDCRHGGFRCTECGMTGASLNEFVPGSDAAGYVSPGRPTFDRGTRTITRDNT